MKNLIMNESKEQTGRRINGLMRILGSWMDEITNKKGKKSSLTIQTPLSYTR